MALHSNENPTNQSWPKYLLDLCIRFFISTVLTPLKSIFTIFYLEEVELENNEAGELMRRSLAPKSWFDKLSFGWVNKSFWIKLISITLLTLTSGAIGLIFHMPLVVMGFVFFLSMGIHILFVAHERNRRQGAAILAEEAIELCKDLEANNKQLTDVIAAGNKLSAELSSHARVLINTNSVIAAQITQINQHRQEYATQVSTLTHDTQGLVLPLRAAEQQLTATTASLQELHKVIEESKNVVHEFQRPDDQFDKTVGQFEASENENVRLVQEFSIFANEKKSSKPIGSDVNLSNIDWKQVDADLDATERLAARMQQSMQDDGARLTK